MGYAKLEDVVAAFVGSICDPDEATNCTAWLIPDDKGVYRMETKGYLCVEASAMGPIPTKADPCLTARMQRWCRGSASTAREQRCSEPRGEAGPGREARREAVMAEWQYRISRGAVVLRCRFAISSPCQSRCIAR